MERCIERVENAGNAGCGRTTKHYTAVNPEDVNAWRSSGYQHRMFADERAGIGSGMEVAEVNPEGLVIGLFGTAPH